jgi:predicted porin
VCRRRDQRMKRSLIALIVVWAAVLPPAARAQFTNVTLYGDLNLDLEGVAGKQPDGTNPTVVRVGSNSSRFGMRGSEYLGAGQVAIFQLESSVQANSGGSTLASRETFVGLQGDWGTVKAGNFLTPYDDILPIFGNTPTLTTSILSTAAVWAQGPLSKLQGGFDARLGNSIRYETPPLDGFSAELQYAVRDDSGTDDPAIAANSGDQASALRHARVVSMGMFYNKGPLDLGVAYEQNTKVRYATANDYALSIAGGYDFGTLADTAGLRLGGVYELVKYATFTGDLKRQFWGVSATVAVGGGTVYAFFGRAGNGTGGAENGTQVGGLTKGPDSSAEQWELSYSYPLSLRTVLYAGYVQINNRANAGYTFNINPYSTAPGARLPGVVFGMAHFF